MSFGRLDASNFQFDDASNIFDSMTDAENVFIDQYHFGDRGNKVIAEGIFSTIRSAVLEEARKIAAQAEHTKGLEIRDADRPKSPVSGSGASALQHVSSDAN